MIEQFRLFAQYNQLMNQRQFAAAAQLSQVELVRDRQAFFGSILGSLNHILVGDIIWLQRFASHPASQPSLDYFLTLETPASLDAMLFSDLNTLAEARVRADQVVVDWLTAIQEFDLAGSCEYKNMKGIAAEKPLVSLISHLFFHQVHHRGQVTTLLSQAGVDFGETDMIEIIDEEAVKNP